MNEDWERKERKERRVLGRNRSEGEGMIEQKKRRKREEEESIVYNNIIIYNNII